MRLLLVKFPDSYEIQLLHDAWWVQTVPLGTSKLSGKFKTTIHRSLSSDKASARYNRIVLTTHRVQYSSFTSKGRKIFHFNDYSTLREVSFIAADLNLSCSCLCAAFWHQKLFSLPYTSLTAQWLCSSHCTVPEQLWSPSTLLCSCIRRSMSIQYASPIATWRNIFYFHKLVENPEKQITKCSIWFSFNIHYSATQSINRSLNPLNFKNYLFGSLWEFVLLSC